MIAAFGIGADPRELAGQLVFPATLSGLQLGELVIATGADALDPETLAGALLKTMEASDAPRREAWRKRGAEFFQGSPRKAAAGPGDNGSGAQTGNSGSASA